LYAAEFGFAAIADDLAIRNASHENGFQAGAGVASGHWQSWRLSVSATVKDLGWRRLLAAAAIAMAAAAAGAAAAHQSAASVHAGIQGSGHTYGIQGTGHSDGIEGSG
jgi:hypothetical protein